MYLIKESANEDQSTLKQLDSIIDSYYGYPPTRFSKKEKQDFANRYSYFRFDEVKSKFSLEDAIEDIENLSKKHSSFPWLYKRAPYYK